jgi:hypothetical protein
VYAQYCALEPLELAFSRVWWSIPDGWAAQDLLEGGGGGGGAVAGVAHQFSFWGAIATFVT